MQKERSKERNVTCYLCRRKTPVSSTESVIVCGERRRRCNSCSLLWFRPCTCGADETTDDRRRGFHHSSCPRSRTSALEIYEDLWTHVQDVEYEHDRAQDRGASEKELRFLFERIATLKYALRLLRETREVNPV